jgi:hypothetical protein
MNISLPEKREANQAAYPGEYGQYYDAAYVAAYNVTFEPFLTALVAAFPAAELDSIDATSEKTLAVKQSTLATIQLATVSCFSDHHEIANEHGREEGIEDAFTDAVSSAKERAAKRSR